MIFKHAQNAVVPAIEFAMVQPSCEDEGGVGWYAEETKLFDHKLKLAVEDRELHLQGSSSV